MPVNTPHADSNRPAAYTRYLIPDAGSHADETEAIRQRLLADARESVPGSTPPTAPDWGAGRPQYEAMTELFGHVEGVVLSDPGRQSGGRPSAQGASWGPTFLVATLRQLRARGLRTLYLDRLVAEHDQPHLDALNEGNRQLAEPFVKRLAALDAQDIPTGKNHPPLSTAQLLQVARREGIRIVALDSLLTTQLAGLPTETIHQAFAYYAAEVIRHHQSLPGSGKWLALVGGPHGSAFKGVPGVAERLQTFSLRLEKGIEQLPTVMLADSGQVLSARNDHPGWWGMADLLLTDRPAKVLSNETLDKTLTPDKFVIRRLADRQTLEVRYGKGDTVRQLVIQRDGNRFHLEHSDWPELDAHRFDDLAELARQLQNRGMEQKLGKPQRIPASPTEGDISPYLLPLRDTRQLEEEGLGIVPPTRSSHLAREELDVKRARLLRDARQPVTLRPRPIPPLVAGDTTSTSLKKILEHAPGIVIGESHEQPWHKAAQTDLLVTLFEHGVRTLYIEGILYELHQPELDQWFATQQLPERFKLHLLRLATLAERDTHGANSKLQLLETATRLGMRIVALECSAGQYLASENAGLFAEKRIPMFNHVAARLIHRHQSLAPHDKWVAITGSAHSNWMMGTPGVAELTGAIGIRLDMALRRQPDQLVVDVGEVLDESSLDKMLGFMQSDLLLTDRTSPLLPPEQQDALLREANDFYIRPLEGSRDFELRYRNTEGTIVSQAVKWHGAQRVSLVDSEWPDFAKNRKFQDLGELCLKLKNSRGMRRQDISSDSFPDAGAYLQKRDALLLHLTWFASAAERAEFQHGKNAPTAIADTLEQLRQEGTTFVSTTALENHFVAHYDTLTLAQKGALLRTLQHQQVEHLDRVAEDWRTLMTSLGAHSVKAVPHNLYLAAAERRQGVCSAITTQIAATRLMEGKTDKYPWLAGDPLAPLDHYLAKMHQAIATPQEAAARLYGLSLLEWKFALQANRFANHPPLTPASHRQITGQLESVDLPAAFELTLGNHAIAIGANAVDGARRYYLADPNYGYAEFDTLAAFQDGLRASQQKMLALSLTQSLPEEHNAFSLRRFRQDLPDMLLFDFGTPTGKPLRLSDLGRKEQLSTLFNRDAPLDKDPRFRRKSEFLATREYQDILKAEDLLRIKRNLQLQNTFQGSWKGWYTRWFDWLLRRNPVAFKVDTFYLASALPDNGVLPPTRRTQLQQMLDYGQAIEPIQRAPEAESMLALTQTRHAAEQLGEHLENSVQRMLADTPQPEHWLPVLSTLKPAGDAGYSLEFRNRLHPEESLQRHSTEPSLPAMSRFLTENSQHLQRANLPGEGLSIDGMNSAFAIQALLRWFGSRERAGVASDPGIGANLALALQIHDYLNLAQIGTGVLSDASHLVLLIKLAQAETTTLPGASTAVLGKAGLLLQLASVGLDIYELTRANDAVQRAVFGTQLTFDSAGVGMGALSALGVEAAGPLAIPLAGLGIGISTLAGIYSGFLKQAQQVGVFFADLHHAYTTQAETFSGGYQLQDGRWLPHGSVVFEEIDLRNGTVRFASPRLYPTVWHWNTAPYVKPGRWANTGQDKARAIDIRQRMGWPEQAPLAVLRDQTLVLPFTSRYYLYSKYQQIPAVCWRHDTGFDLLRRLNGDDFRFDVNIFIQYAITELHPEYVDHEIMVRLGEHSPRLQMPPAMESAHGLDCCLFAEAGGQHLIDLQAGIRIILRAAQPDTTRWILDGRHLDNDTVQLSSRPGDWQQIGGVQLRLYQDQAAGSVTLLCKNGDVVQLELGSQHPGQSVSQIDAAALPGPATGHLLELKGHHRLLGQAVEVRNYLPPGSEQRIEHAFFDIARERYLYIAAVANGDTDGSPKRRERFRHTLLAALTDQDAYFYNRTRTKLLRVDPEHHTVTHQYALPLEAGQPLRVWSEQGILLLGSGHTLPGSAVYRLVGEWLVLHRIYADDALIADMAVPSNRRDAARLLQRYLNAPLSASEGPSRPSTAQLPLSGLIQIDRNDNEGALRQRYWLRPDDGTLLEPQPAGEAAFPDDLQLVALERLDEGSETAVFHSEKRHMIWQHTAGGSTRELTVTDFSHLGQVGGQLMVTTHEGLVQRLAADGSLQLYAVKRSWLQARTEGLNALRALAAGKLLVLLDLKRIDGTAQPAWLSHDKVVLSGTNLPASVPLLGLSASRNAAYFHDTATHQLYRQVLLDDRQLDATLGLQHPPGADGQSPSALRDVPAAEPAGRFSKLVRFGSTLTAVLDSAQLPPLLDGIDQLLITPPVQGNSAVPVLIDQAQWTHYQRMVIDLDPLETPTGLQVELALDNPLALEVSLGEEGLQLFDRASGRALLVNGAFGNGQARLGLRIRMPDGRTLDLPALQQGWQAPEQLDDWPVSDGGGQPDPQRGIL